MRRLLVAVLLLVAALVVADRVCVHYADRAVADRIKASEGVTSASVSIGGFPFLTQAVAGDYSDVHVTIDGLRRGGMDVHEVAMTLHGVHVPLKHAFNGTVSAVPVDSAAGTVVLTYADFDARLAPDHIRVSYGGTPGTVRLTSFFGVSATTHLSAHGQTITATAGPGGILQVSLELTGLPFGVAFTGLTTDPQAVTLTAAGEEFTLSPTGG